MTDDETIVTLLLERARALAQAMTDTAQKRTDPAATFALYRAAESIRHAGDEHLTAYLERPGNGEPA